MFASPSSAVLDRRQLDFPPDRRGGGCVSEGIDFTRHALAVWHLTGPRAADDTVLVAAELLANAAEHAGGPLALGLEKHPGRLRIAVTDTSPARPRLQEDYRPDTPHGHGLILVDRIAADWGWAADGGGKAVWVEVTIPSEPDPRPAHRAARADPDPLFDN
ncbi:ATP-binding protein [Kitasatospora sp. NPDC085895]|uniref:ATP-binding protein n=1 Tax=Kitasatospora sp. NPDC085895 TaxID=3155057 RepID=UPI00344E3604